MPLLNYTTSVATDKTVAEIQRILTKHGATAILVENDDTGCIVALSFKIPTDRGIVAFKLPSDWRPVLKLLEQDRKVPRAKKTKEQALRVSWRILKDWIEAQLALIETRMVKVDQVFLPYAMTQNGQTLYEHVQSTNLLAPPAA